MEMKRVLVAATFGISVLAFAPMASAVVINFDALTPGTLVSTPISGVTFTLDNGELPSISNVAATSAPNALLNAEAFSFSEPEGNLTMTFGTPVNNLFFSVIFENGDLALDVFQGLASSSVTVVFDGSPTDGDVVDLSSFSAVTAVTLTHAFPDDYYLIDDIRFDVAAPAPEPASLGILALGLVVAGIGVRRRKHQSRKI